MKSQPIATNRHNVSKLNALLPLAVGALLMTAGCASLSERQLEEREYRNVDYAERFKAARSQCRARGGRMYVNASSKLDRNGVPNRGDRYFCS